MDNLQHDETGQNDLNIKLKGLPWYQSFLRQAGQNPNRVHLNDQQREQLSQLAAQNGVQLPKGVQFDPSGNVNEQHGFAGQPGWLKALEIGGAGTAAAVFGGPALMSLFGNSAAPTAGVAGSTTAGSSAASSLPLVAGQHALTTGMGLAEPTLAGAVTAGGTVGASAGGVGSTIGKFLGKNATPENLADAGDVLGSFSEAEANNRMARGGFAQNRDRLMLEAAGNRREDESDAMRKLSQANYIGSGGSQFKPPTITLGGVQRTAPNLGYGPIAPSDAMKQGATSLQEQMLARLKPGGSYTPTPLDQYGDRGTAEKLSNYGSAISSGLGTARKIFGF